MENNDGWDFNAPQYVDFSGALSLQDDDNADEYFDYDHENGVPVSTGDDTGNGTMDSAMAGDVFSTPQSEVRQTRSATNLQAVSGNGTPKAGTPQRVARSKSTAGNGTPKAGTPQRVARSKSTAGTPQRVLRSKTPTGMPQRVLRSKTPTEGNSDPAKDSVKQDSEEDRDTETHVVHNDEKLQTPSPRVTRSGKVITPNTIEKHYAALQKKKTTPSNICTNLEEWRKKTAGAKTVHNNKETTKDDDNLAKKQQKALRRSETLPKRQRPVVPERSRTPTKTQASSLKRSSSFTTVNQHNQSSDAARGRNHKRGLSGERSSHRLRSGSNSSNKSDSEKVGVTIPTTPTLLKRKPIKMQPQGALKNSEQLEMEKISYFRQELAKKRKLAQESCKTALNGKVPTFVPQTKEITKPEGFKFETDSRIKSHGMETRNDSDVKDFASTLRSDKGKQPATVSKHTTTKPEPFKLSAQRKRRLPDLDEKQAEKYESMAEKLAQFTKTPDRFRSKSKGGPTEQKRGRSKSPQGVTVPKTPQFETRTRSRPVTAPTREDMEQKEIEEMQKNQFKAQPVNQKIFKNPSIKKVPIRAPTVPEEFHLSAGVKKHHDKEQPEEHFEFHAQPLNKKILEGPVGVKEPKKLPPTVPESPAFALKHRARIPVVEEPKEEKPNLRARPSPHFGIPFQPHYEHKATEPEPFGFEEREKRRAEEKKKKIEQALEEERRQREFHANPIPDLKPHLPPKVKRPLTVAQPFSLDTDNRGLKKAEEWSRKIQDEIEQQRERARFKAKNATVLEHDPFIPHKENKYTTADISEFDFNTAKRTVKREAFEMHKKAKMDELDNIRLQEQRMREAEEQAELERMRKEAVHKANPIKKYKGVEIKGSEKPLTAPMSPRFQTDIRLRTRAQHAESFMSS